MLKSNDYVHDYVHLCLLVSVKSPPPTLPHTYQTHISLCTQLVSSSFEPSQPQRITSGLSLYLLPQSADKLWANIHLHQTRPILRWPCVVDRMLRFSFSVHEYVYICNDHTPHLPYPTPTNTSVVFFNCVCPMGISPMGNSGCFLLGKPAVTQSHYQPTVHAGCFSVSIIKSNSDMDYRIFNISTDVNACNCTWGV